ncbi:MAG TPA: cupin domain-containing protein [Candidatus Paceibacterota bacterium]|nr:cupin domain-containing protein [Candidatus Paceibacterota bacterium]
MSLNPSSHSTALLHLRSIHQDMNSKPNAIVQRADDVARRVVSTGVGISMQMLIGPDVAPHFLLRRFVIEPGGSMPKHTNRVEHGQYVVRGRAKVGIGDKVYDVQSGDVVFIPQGWPHWYKTEGNEAFEFLCVVPNVPDETTLLDRD